jgi:predicted ATPase/transcriptional regulator with XRE-family HTH domain
VADEDFQDWLRRRRKELDLTQEELGRQVGCAPTTIRRIESGARRPSRQIAERLAQALALAPDGRAPERAAVTRYLASTILPAPVTPLIGRQQACIAACQCILGDSVRLLTLCGPPGVGKTRLGLQVAADLQTHFTQGVVYVPLAPVRSHELVAAAIAQALGLTEIDVRPLDERIMAALHHRHMLLVLDNFEHVIDAAPLVAQLLASCPRLVVLLTCRTILRLAGETVHVVAPLDLPPETLAHTQSTTRPEPREHTLRGEEAATAAAVGAYASVALFVERAQATRPDFRLHGANAADVATICRRLDGLPLAIELAAARVRLFTPRMILERLDRRLQLLTAGLRDAPERQHTLRHALDWSYALLSPDEQHLFSRLGVFVGGWNIIAAVAVGGYSLSRTTDLLDALVTHSLIQVRDDLHDESRFTLLETTREYALEQLDRLGEVVLIRRRHAEHYLAVVEAAEQDLLRGPGQAAALARITPDIPNFRAVLAWALETDADTDDADSPCAIGLRVNGALQSYYIWRGSFAEGIGWFEDLFARQESVDAAARAKGLSGIGVLNIFVNPVRGTEYLRHSLELYQSLGDERQTAPILHFLARSLRHQGDLDASEKASHEALTLLRRAGALVDCAWVLLNLGDCARDRRDVVRAEQHFNEALKLCRRHGDTLGTGYALANLGRVAHALGQNSRARLLLEESISVLTVFGAPGATQGVIESLAYVLHMLGDESRALMLFQESLAYWWAAGSRFHIPILLEGLAAVAICQGAAARAAQLLGAAAALRETLVFPLGGDLRADYERDLAATRAALAPHDFTAAWEEGRAMPLEHMISAALRASD